MYFRYVITYLNAKRDGNKSWVDKIDGRHVFWASPGPYLEKSTLISLGRSISGFELPEALYKGNTFNGEPGLDTTEGQEILLSSRLRDAIIESAKGPTDTDDEEDED